MIVKDKFNPLVLEYCPDDKHCILFIKKIVGLNAACHIEGIDLLSTLFLQYSETKSISFVCEVMIGWGGCDLSFMLSLSGWGTFEWVLEVLEAACYSMLSRQEGCLIRWLTLSSDSDLSSTPEISPKFFDAKLLSRADQYHYWYHADLCSYNL